MCSYAPAMANNRRNPDRTAAAWVPYDDTITWPDAFALAATWGEAEAAARSSKLLVVTTQAAEVHGVPAIASYEKRGMRTTPRRGGTDKPHGAVLAYAPTPEDLAFATRLAGQTALVAVEYPDFSLAGWARCLGATDLTTGTPAEPYGEEMLDTLRFLKQQSNNGFTRGFGRTMAEGALADLGASGALDPVELPGAALAAGITATAVRELTKMIAALP